MIPREAAVTAATAALPGLLLPRPPAQPNKGAGVCAALSPMVHLAEWSLMAFNAVAGVDGPSGADQTRHFPSTCSARCHWTQATVGGGAKEGGAPGLPLSRMTKGVGREAGRGQASSAGRLGPLRPWIGVNAGCSGGVMGQGGGRPHLGGSTGAQQGWRLQVHPSGP